jgi:hypothetical protein
VQRLFEPEGAAVEHVGHRRVRGEAERLWLQEKADVVAAAGPLGIARPPGARVEQDRTRGVAAHGRTIRESDGR